MTSTTHENAKPYGSGNGLFYLWHLQSIGLVHQDESPSDLWQDSLAVDQNQPVRVAVIDNGCSQMEHPNLPQSRIVNPMEFTGFLEGAVYGASGDETIWGGSGELETLKLEDLLHTHAGASKPVRDTLLALSKGPISPHCYQGIENPCDRFAAHGTAVAGLIAAEPEATAGEKEAQCKREADLRRRFPTKINYCGVNPFAEIIPINTVYDSSYGPVIMALLYAVDQKADIILMPRVVSEMGEPFTNEELIKTDDPRATRLDSHERQADKALFEEVLKLASDHIPTVVAAGNDGRAAVKFPGKLKVAPTSTANVHSSLFVAGAATASGSLSSYSSGAIQEGITFMPSDDAPVINQRFFRPDPNAWNTRHIKSVRGTQPDPFAFTSYALLSIDIPGQYGYASEGRLNTDYDAGFGANNTMISRSSDEGDRIRTLEAAPRSLYSVFGGTSGASAILAGVLSLCQNIYRRKHGANARLTGAVLWDLVEKAGTKNFIPLLPDEGVDAAHKARPKTIDLARLFDGVENAAAPE